MQVDFLFQGDCLDGFSRVEAQCVDLAFADPPFNIGYDYDVYDDRKERSHYLNWSRIWIGGLHRVLKPTGTFWLAIGDEYAAELKIISQEIGFTCRSWVIWYYTCVAGTFKERAGFHGCQMPEQLLGRIVRASSNESDPPDIVLDPFAGSGTSLVVAKKLQRDYIGFDLSADYVKQSLARLKS